MLTLAAGIGLLTYRLARRFNWPEREALWIVLSVTLGSPLTYLVLRATVFDAYLAHLLALLCLLAALAEYLEKRQPWVTGALLGLSAMARPLTVLAVLFFLLMELAAAASWGKKLRHATALLAPLLVAVIAGYNALRFGNPLEAGYTYQLIDPDTAAACRGCSPGRCSCCCPPHPSVGRG